MTACHTRRELNLEDRCQNSLRCRYKQTKDKTATTPPPHPPRLTFNTLSWHSLERQRHFVVGCSLSGCYSVQWREKSKPAPETQEGLLISWPALGTLRKSRRQKGTPPNKRLNEHNNGCARAYKSLYVSCSPLHNSNVKSCVFWRAQLAAANFQ